MGGLGKKWDIPLLCLVCVVYASIQLYLRVYNFIVLSVSFAIGTMTEINQLRIALQESATARNITEGQCISLKVDCLCCLRMKIEASYFFSDCFFSHCGCTCIENA